MNRGLPGALTAPQAPKLLSIGRARFGRIASRIAECGTLNPACVYAEASRELRQVIGIPGEPKRDRDYARLGKASGRHFSRFADQGEEFVVAR